MLAKINGAEIGFDDVGEGTPLLLIHAGIADRSMWDRQVDVLGDSSRDSDRPAWVWRIVDPTGAIR